MYMIKVGDTDYGNCPHAYGYNCGTIYKTDFDDFDTTCIAIK